MKTILITLMLTGALILTGCGSSSSGGGGGSSSGGTSTEAIQGTWSMDPAALDQSEAFKAMSTLDQATTKAALQGMAGMTMKISGDQLYFKMSDKPGDNSTYDYTVAGREGDTWTLDTIRYKGTTREAKDTMKLTLANGMLMMDFGGTPMVFKKSE